MSESKTGREPTYRLPKSSPYPVYGSAVIHRLVAVAEYGFDAVVENHVHHKNHIPWDNRPSNLELMSQEEHYRYHAEERFDIENTDYRDKSTLKELFEENDYSIKQVALMFDVTQNTILRWMRKRDIERDTGNSWMDKIEAQD
jgi:transcriptional regulator with PAS, ATPase and Fis domain